LADLPGVLAKYSIQMSYTQNIANEGLNGHEFRAADPVCRSNTPLGACGCFEKFKAEDVRLPVSLSPSPGFVIFHEMNPRLTPRAVFSRRSAAQTAGDRLHCFRRIRHVVAIFCTRFHCLELLVLE
jgi:hypothetical protein